MYLFIITYKISCVLFDILIKKALSSQCERKKGDIFKSYSFTGANVNAQSVLLNVGIKREP